MERTYTLQDLLAALRRRRTTALAVAAAVAVIGVVVALALPSEYSAQSVVQLEPRRLLADFMPAQPVVPFEDRMRTLKHGILARPVLERVIRETDFFPDLRDDMDQAVDRMRRSVEVRLEGEVAGGPPSLLFVVEVRGRDPQKVARAAESLPRIYAETTRAVMQQQAKALRVTLDAQAEDMSKALAGYEQKILAFKVEHASELPEMVETNARSLGRSQAMVEMTLAGLADARHRKAMLLAAIPEGASSAGMAETALDAALRKVQAAQAAYGPDHPDVLRARREYDEAKARRQDELTSYKKDRIDQQVAAIDSEIRENEAALKGFQAEVASYQSRLDAAPRWGQQLAIMSRDYETLRAKYVSTVSRRADAAASESLLAADVSSLFHVIQPATPSGRPVAPDRPRLLWLALLAAVACGLGAAGVTEWVDSSLRGPEDAGAFGVPVLAAIPRIGPAGRGQHVS